jgi:hypothetical protein
VKSDPHLAVIRFTVSAVHKVLLNIVSIILDNYLVERFYTYYVEMSKFPNLNFLFVQILLRQ